MGFRVDGPVICDDRLAVALGSYLDDLVGFRCLQLVDNAVHHIAEDDLVPRVVEAAAVSTLNLPGRDADQDTYNSATNPLPMLPAPKCTAFMVLIWGFGDLVGKGG